MKELRLGKGQVYPVSDEDFELAARSCGGCGAVTPWCRSVRQFLAWARCDRK